MEVILVFWLLCGVVCAAIASSKNRSAVGWFIIGLIIGIFGIILIAVLPGQDKVPPGLHAVKCPRCNAVQNVSDPDYFRCWQCKMEVGSTAA